MTYHSHTFSHHGKIKMHLYTRGKTYPRISTTKSKRKKKTFVYDRHVINQEALFVEKTSNK